MLVGVVTKRGDDRARAVVRDLLAHLADTDARVVLEEATRDALAETDGLPDAVVDRPPGESANEGSRSGAAAFPACDLVVSVGGDGTFLFAARRSDGTPVLGVNLGEVGFLNAVPPEDAVDAVASVLGEVEDRGSPSTTDLPQLSVTGPAEAVTPAVNEVVVQGPQRGRGGGADLAVRVDGSRYSRGHADGVLVATATGSTAYNLSEGGPLIHPAVPAIVVTGMASDDRGPLVVPDDSEVSVAVSGADRAYVVSDGRETVAIDPPTTVTVARSDSPVRVAGPSREFFDALDKLD